MSQLYPKPLRNPKRPLWIALNAINRNIEDEDDGNKAEQKVQKPFIH